MGTRGPVPHRSNDLSRERDVNRSGRPDITRGELLPTDIPEADPEWHEIAKMLWEGAATSGQRDYYQNSDWALLYSLCDDFSDYKNQGRRSATMAATLYAATSSLLLTEGDRRRARIELSAPVENEDDASITVLAGYKDALTKGAKK